VTARSCESINQLLKAICGFLNLLSLSLAGLKQPQMSEDEFIALLEWITPLNFLQTHDDYVKRRQEGTGQWFLDSDEYQKWYTEPGATLWCTGNRMSPPSVRPSPAVRSDPPFSI
jgi:hypothetical protein